MPQYFLFNPTQPMDGPNPCPSLCWSCLLNYLCSFVSPDLSALLYCSRGAHLPFWGRDCLLFVGYFSLFLRQVKIIIRTCRLKRINAQICQFSEFRKMFLADIVAAVTSYASISMFPVSVPVPCCGVCFGPCVSKTPTKWRLVTSTQIGGGEGSPWPLCENGRKLCRKRRQRRAINQRRDATPRDVLTA